MRMPTDEELAKIEVTEEDEREFEALRVAIAKALAKARIPVSVDWAFVMLVWVATASSLQGITRPFLLQMVADAYAQHGEPARRTASVRLPPKFSLDDKLQIGPRINRLVGALEAAKIELVEPGTLLGMLCIAGQVFGRMGIAEHLFLEGAGLAYDLADERMAEMAQQSGNKA